MTLSRATSMVGAGLAAVGAFTGGSAAHAASGTPSCAMGALVAWLDTNGDSAAGSTYFKLKLTNLSGRRCALRGYPGVSAVDLAGRQLGSAAGRNAHTRPSTVGLAPGRTAAAVLQIAHAGVYPTAECRPVTAAGLRVYPPNQRGSKVVPLPFRACSRVGPVYLHVQAVTLSG
jgi:Domain of unknown function (DUF4232)